jgi:hypothetical protein
MQLDNIDCGPGKGYLDMILEGYQEYDIPNDQIWTALAKIPTLIAN